MFTNAKLGDKFITRNGKIAIYLHPCKGPFKDNGHHIVVYTDADTYASNGKLWSIKDLKDEDETDIIGPYIENINLDILENIAVMQYTQEHDKLLFIEGFKAGYKYAKYNN